MGENIRKWSNWQGFQRLSLFMKSDLLLSQSFKICLIQDWGYVTKFHFFFPKKWFGHFHPKISITYTLDHACSQPRFKYKVLQLCTFFFRSFFVSFFLKCTFPFYPTPLPSLQPSPSNPTTDREGDRNHSIQRFRMKFSWKDSNYLWCDQLSIGPGAGKPEFLPWFCHR